MKCPKCGTIIEDNSKYCFMCGIKIDNVDKTGFILSIIAAITTLFGVNIIINSICIVIAILSIVFTYLKKAKKYYFINLGLSCYAIIASIILILFILL